MTDSTFSAFSEVNGAGVVTGAQTFTGLPNYIDALLNQTPAHYWNYGSFGTQVTVTYNFPTWYSTNPNEGPAYAFTASEMNYARQAIALWSDVANINFVEVSASGTSDIEIRKVSMDPGVAGGTFYPHTVISGIDFGGSIYLDPAYSPAAPGTYNFLTIVHELGHALGLKHPGNYNAGGGGTEGPYLPAGEDNHSHTVMSYYDAAGLSGVNALTPMIDDIAAIQYVYGSRASHTGDDTYTFSTAAQIKTIWDAGGSDTIDISNQTSSCFISLIPGTFSSIGTGGQQLNNIGIAYNCYIENVVGSSSHDVIYGNDIANNLDGRAGGDSMYGFGGNDYITATGSNNTAFGGEGSDQLYFTTNSNQLYGENGNDWLGANGNANALLGGNGDDYLTGHGNSNTLVGEAGNDQMNFSGDGNFLYGDDGADFIYVSSGNSNTLYGGNGNDWLGLNGNNNTQNGGAGNDWIGASGTGNSVSGGGGGDTLFAYGFTNYLYSQDGAGGGTWLGVSGSGNFLFGNAGNDWLGATGNNNTFDPGAGNDTMVAATHTGDVFVFKPAYGHDNITGFAPGSAATDVIDLRAFHVDYASLMANDVADVAGNAVIHFGADDLTLISVTKAELTAGDFLLT